MIPQVQFRKKDTDPHFRPKMTSTQGSYLAFQVCSAGPTAPTNRPSGMTDADVPLFKVSFKT